MTELESKMLGPAGATLARETLELMRAYAIPPTGPNYQVWLTYRVTPSPQLKEAIETRIGSGEAFTSSFNDELYQRFCASEDPAAQILSASHKLARDLADVVNFLRNAEEKSGTYGRALENAANDLHGSLSTEQIRQVVSSLAAATIDMAQHNQQLNDQLQKSTREVDSLRANLESVRIESLTDALTGLANRRMFDETLRMRIDEARAQKTDLFLMLVDVDHFKRFNDTWGHHTGDQILRFLASALQAYARPDFLVARYGGEEFAVVMPRLTGAAAAQAAETIRSAIQAKRLRRRSTNEDLGQVTVSMGIARLQASDTPQGLIERADACLYSSKRNGRNQVTTDQTPVLYVA